METRINQSTTQKNYVKIENCSFLRTVDWNQPIISYDSVGYLFTFIKNSLFYNKQTGKMLPEARVMDMGDGKWTETAYATFTQFGKTYQTGVVITRNNARLRLGGKTIDIGCGEYWTPLGLMLLVK